MSPKKLVRKKGQKGKAEESSSSREAKKKNATTMPIPVDALFDDIPADHTLALQVSIPGKQPFIVPADEQELVIGRDSHCAVYLPIENVSREHARILRNGEIFTLEDLDSTNGTFVNNVRIVSCALHQSDQIRIGQARINIIRMNPA